MTESQGTAEEKKIKELIERYATGDSLSEKVRNLLTAQGGLTHIPPYQLAVVEVVKTHEILIQKESMERAKKLTEVEAHIVARQYSVAREELKAIRSALEGESK